MTARPTHALSASHGRSTHALWSESDLGLTAWPWASDLRVLPLCEVGQCQGPWGSQRVRWALSVRPPMCASAVPWARPWVSSLGGFCTVCGMFGISAQRSPGKTTLWSWNGDREPLGRMNEADIGPPHSLAASVIISIFLTNRRHVLLLRTAYSKNTRLLFWQKSTLLQTPSIF